MEKIYSKDGLVSIDGLIRKHPPPLAGTKWTGGTVIAWTVDEAGTHNGDPRGPSGSASILIDTRILWVYM